jgi:hypothetical protein
MHSDSKPKKPAGCPAGFFGPLKIIAWRAKGFVHVGRVPMTVSHQHLRGCAGASFTKAVALCRAQMSPVVISWNKQRTGPGLQA